MKGSAALAMLSMQTGHVLGGNNNAGGRSAHTNSAGDQYVSAQYALSSRMLNVGKGILQDASARQPHSIQVGAANSDSLRFEVRTGERAIFDIRSNSPVDRSEVYTRDTGRFAYGTTFFWSFSMLVEDGPDVTGDWCVLSQLHQSGEHPLGYGVNPPLAICWHTEGSPRLSILARTGKTGEINTHYIKPNILFADDQYQRGVWVDWQFQFRFNHLGNAEAIGWRDGKKVFDYQGSAFKLGYEWDSSPVHGVYTQFGVYRSSAAPGNPWRNPDVNPMAVQFSRFIATQDVPPIVKIGQDRGVGEEKYEPIKKRYPNKKFGNFRSSLSGR